MLDELKAAALIAALMAGVLGIAVSAILARANCAIVGDSIALGVGLIMRECLADAKSGIPSADVIARVHPADVLFVSAGSNDPTNPQLEDNLSAIRAKASAAVVWIEPLSRPVAAVVRRVADSHNDAVVQFEPSSDGVHPRSYNDLAIALRKYLK